ncbi:hypothetical protein VNO80_16022 [Phaseolus coccineus]|uniref:Uncharacterized protein n=1 Tax=Phaseolus coccineus TaxID=3886 RepID=A0AAN9R2B9_PHACN
MAKRISFPFLRLGTTGFEEKKAPGLERLALAVKGSNPSLACLDAEDFQPPLFRQQLRRGFNQEEWILGIWATLNLFLFFCGPLRRKDWMLRLDKHLRASSLHLLWHLSPAHSESQCHSLLSGGSLQVFHSRLSLHESHSASLAESKEGPPLSEDLQVTSIPFP